MTAIIVTDAFGNTLTSGDSVQLTRELSVKGTKVTLKKSERRGKISAGRTMLKKSRQISQKSKDSSFGPNS